nr:hypothetical protein [uncultured Mediterranean phage uvMED]
MLKVVSLLIIILFTACSKDINLDPIHTVGNKVVQTLLQKTK